MNTVSVGPWALETPADWAQQEGVAGTPYLEAQDGTKGCYIRSITFTKPYRRADKAIEEVQGAHERAFLHGAQMTWTVLDRTTSKTSPVVHSTLDLYDREKHYRVLMVVLATTREAVQITLHDYDCQNREHSDHVLLPVARSLRRSEKNS